MNGEDSFVIVKEIPFADVMDTIIFLKILIGIAVVFLLNQLI